MHATDTFEAGWLVSIVRIQWYKLMQVSQRAYVLLREEHIVPVNTIVRLLGLSFSNSAAAGIPSTSAERVTRSAARQDSKLHFFDEDSHNLVETACRHQSAELGQEPHAS